MKRGKLPLYCLFLCLSLLLLVTGCEKKEVKTEIVIGASRSLSGEMKITGDSAFAPIMKMWIEEVNASGGIYIKKYDKKLPLRTIIYDDESDEEKMIRNIEKLIVEDKVDFIFPPVGTHMLFAAAPVVNKYNYLLLGAEGGASRIKEIIGGLPYLFCTLSFADHYQVPVLADLMENVGVKSAAIMFIADDIGVEYSGLAVTQMALKGVKVEMVKSIPPVFKDSQITNIIQEAKAADVDAFLSLGYPDQNFPTIAKAMELGFNPKLYITGPGANFQFFNTTFGPAAEGIMSWGAWNKKTSQGHKELAEKLASKYGEDIIDWWGHNLYYASLQYWQKAVEKEGNLDQEKLKDIFATEKFDTILGPTWFDENHLLAADCHTGEVGQWQNGTFEIVGPVDKATAPLEYPKPKWPAAQ